MIRGIGTDIIEIERVEKAMKINRFKNKVFTNLELNIIDKMGISTAAANFAGKEAVSKAFGTGIRGFSLLDIEILRDSLGKPYVTFYNGAKLLTNKFGITNVNISISHCKQYAVAFVIMETR